MAVFLHDLRSACRALIRRPATSGIAAALIAAGIGLNTAIFSVLDAIVFRTLAAPHPRQLVHINGVINGTWQGVPYGIIERLRGRTDVFAGVSGWSDTPTPVEAAGQTAVALVVRVDSDIHRVIGTAPRRGRVLAREDRGAVAVISDRFWRERLAAAPDVLGRTLRAGNVILTIVGVMPPEFTGATAAVPWDVTAPLDNFIGNRPRGQVLMDTIARLKPGVTLEAARAQVQAMWPQLLADTLPPGRSPDDWAASIGNAVQVVSASRGRFFWREQYEHPLALLLGMAALLLLIVCSNIATLLLARAIGRQKETGIRLALGASRGRLARESLLETALLALAGMALSLPITRWSNNLSIAFLPSGNVPFHYNLDLNARAFAFALALCLFTALACGLIPALRTAGADALDSIQRRNAAAPGGVRLRRLLLVVQVALSSMLVAGALLFAVTLRGVASSDFGFRPAGLLDVVVQGKPGSPPASREYFDELFRRLRALPGVEQVSAANQLPLQYPSYGTTMAELSQPGEGPTPVEWHCAFPGYFAALGAPLLQGREFQPRDTRAAIVNQGLARRLSEAGGVMGRMLRLRWNRKTADWNIVGVAPDIKYSSPREQTPPAIYVPCLEEWTPQQAASTGMGIAIRGGGRGLEARARREVEMPGRQYVIKSPPMRELVRQRLLRERMLAFVSSVYGGATLAVVAVGLYGLMAFVVAARAREIAIRVALGAHRKHVQWLVARESLMVAGAGAALGLGGVAGCARLISGYLYGVRAFDPMWSAVTLSIVAATAACAAFIPVRRALALEPALALRQE